MIFFLLFLRTIEQISLKTAPENDRRVCLLFKSNDIQGFYRLSRLNPRSESISSRHRTNEEKIQPKRIFTHRLS